MNQQSNFSFTISLAAAVALTPASAVCSHASEGAVPDKIKSLRIVRDSIGSNVAAIETLQLAGDVMTEFAAPQGPDTSGEERLTYTGTVAFWIDLVSNSAVSDLQMEPLEKSANSVEIVYGYDEICVFERDHLAVLERNDRYGALADYADDPVHKTGVPTQLASRSTQAYAAKVNDAGRHFDPRRIFSVGAVGIHQEVSTIVAALDGEMGAEVAEDVDRNLKVVELDSGDLRVEVNLSADGRPPGWWMKTVAVYSRDSSYMPIKHQIIVSGIVQNESKWRYVPRGGVAVPTTFSVQSKDPATGEFRIKREYAFQDINLNGAGKNTQPAAAIGQDLKEGGRFLDRTTGDLMVKTGGEFVAAGDYVPKNVLAAKRDDKDALGFRSAVLMLNAVLLVFLVAYFGFRSKLR